MTSPPDTPTPNFDHLLSMSDDRGTFEHALFSEPRVEHGYCTDDMARVLVVTTREPDPSPAVRDLTALSLKFLQAALDSRGKIRNRLNSEGIWEDSSSVDDCWGRCIWGLGTAAAHSDDELVRLLATRMLERTMKQRSPWLKSMAFAALGAAELLSVSPRNVSAHALLSDAADVLTRSSQSAEWPWPEPRLTYANATLPEAMIAGGFALNRPALLQRGLELLEWLLDRESHQGRLSVTPAGGSGPDDHGPGFDQQPIEVSALADACARAESVDSDSRRQWADGINSAVNWFLGDNDGHVVMWDPISGGAFDGLEMGGANLNQGTESSLALLSTLQHARTLMSVAL
jgi:hypothetical protein